MGTDKSHLDTLHCPIHPHMKEEDHVEWCSPFLERSLASMTSYDR